MPVVLLILVGGLVGLSVATAALRWPARSAGAPRTSVAAAREAGRAVARRPRLARFARRTDPEAATGLALTLALIVLVGGGLALAVLAALVRGTTEVVRVDRSVAEWAHAHATTFSEQALKAFTDLGSPGAVVAMAVLLGVVETIRTRSRWIIPFLVVVVGGNAALTTTIKDLADRARPTLDPVAATFGPSFPSGHSSYSAAFLAAAALVLGRERARGTRAALAGMAAGLAAAVAASRVLLDAHWLSDVLGGLALGWAWFAACSIAFGGRLLRFGAPVAAAQRAAAAQGHDPAAASGRSATG